MVDLSIFVNQESATHRDLADLFVVIRGLNESIDDFKAAAAGGTTKYTSHCQKTAT